MLNGHDNENGKKGLFSKTQLCMFTKHTFFYISLLLFCMTTTWNFLVTRFMEEMSYVFLSAFF